MSNADENTVSHINSVFVKEGFPYKREALIEMLSLNVKNYDEEKATNLIKQLLYMRLLTKSTNKYKESSEGDYATDYEDLDFDDSKTWKSLSFTFVGLYYFNGVLIKSIPKYFQTDIDTTNPFEIEKDEVLPKFKQVLKVIEKYKDKLSQKIPSFDYDSDGNHLSLVLSIIQDYYENGLYNRDQTIKEINGNGTIDWDYTVNNYYPIIKNNKPYYLECRTVRRNLEEDNYFFRLHKAIITSCSKELKECDLNELMGFDELELSDEGKSDFGEEDEIIYNIEKELNSQFNTQKQETLKMLKTYIAGNEKTIKNSDDLKLFRVNKFDRVWEDVCRVAVGDDLDTKLGETIIKQLKESKSEHLKNLKADATYKDVMERPKWFPQENSDEYATSDPLILDSIKLYKDSLLIFDAKYYVPNLTLKKAAKESDESENKNTYTITNMPGIGDITKQYLYQLAYKDFSEITKIRITSNMFLMPKDDETKPNPLCEIRMEMFENLGISLQNIKVLQVSAKDMYECYLKDKPKELSYFMVKKEENEEMPE